MLAFSSAASCQFRSSILHHSEEFNSFFPSQFVVVVVVVVVAVCSGHDA